MRMLFIGDIIGRPGRNSVAHQLPRLRDEFAIDFVIANGENTAGGLGATPKVLDELMALGVQAITLGNHAWRKKELLTTISNYSNVIRPENFPENSPGRGYALFDLPCGGRLGLVNIVGRVFMEPFESPFTHAKQAVEILRQSTPIILVDFHAEATSEKVAMGWYLDGQCTAVVGTHTHVQTADERILPKGTAYISDVGMTGPFDSVIGMERELILRRFITGMPVEFQVANARTGLNAVLIEVDNDTGRAVSIQRINRLDEDFL